MDKKNEFIKLEENFNNMLNDISEKMTKSLLSFIMSLKSNEIKLGALSFSLNSGERIFIKRVFISFDNKVVVEYTRDNYTYHTFYFDSLPLSYKSSLYYALRDGKFN